jgi:hypothetical protein
VYTWFGPCSSNKKQFDCRFSELEYDLRGRIELSLQGSFAYIDTGEAKVQLDYAKVYGLIIEEELETHLNQYIRILV